MAKQGKIVTFYSYKGGVGRSFALANIAALLSKWGAKVLCIDWDLEAPGLNYYLDPYFDGRHKVGLADILSDYERTGEFSWRDAITPAKIGSRLSNIDFISSGSKASGYFDRIRDIRISELYEDNLGWDLQTARGEWAREYDFTFIDCRTGITEVGGLCVSHLADIVCPIFTANDQSLDGTVDVIRRADELRRGLPFDLPTLLKLPILSRFDRREETDRAEAWLDKSLARIQSMYSPWATDKIDLSLLLTLTTIPYISRWTFGEEIATLEEKEADPEAITYSMASIAALISQGMSGAERLVAARDVYVARARRHARVAGRYANDIFLSAAESKQVEASLLAQELRRLGLTVCVGKRDGLSHVGKNAARDISESRHMIMYVDDMMEWYQAYEAETFIIQSLNDDESRQFFPLVGGRSVMERLPPYMRRYQFIDTKRMDAADIANRVNRQIVRFSTTS